MDPFIPLRKYSISPKPLVSNCLANHREIINNNLLAKQVALMIVLLLVSFIYGFLGLLDK